MTLTTAAEERPRWVAWLPFLAGAPALSARHWQLLGLVSVVTLFDQYDRALFSLALPRIQADLAIAEADVGTLGAIVRLGALPALGLAFAADRIGRRRALLATVLGYTLLTGATALAPDARSFIALQFLARMFTAAQMVLAVVVIAEEFDPQVRGWGVGALLAIQGLGVGLAVIGLPLVDASGLGWRALFAAGLLPLLLLPRLARALPETGRFEASRRGRLLVDLDSASRPMRFARLRLAARSLRSLASQPRLAALAAVSFAVSAGVAAGDFLGPKYLMDGHGWAAGQVTLLYLGAGLFGIAGNVVAGRVSDRVGRRPVTVSFLVALVAAAVGFFNASGAWLPPLWTLTVFTLTGTEVLISAYAAELFPTATRSTAGGIRLAVATLGGVAGLLLESLLYRALGSHWHAVTVLSCFALVGAVIVARNFPETAARSLEEIAPEPAAEENASLQPCLPAK